ncbi:unnamed protein product [Allacma fusca]|uniref:Glycine-rich protein n=2 Tax=Allacma fusca TaxID=39272 RepID=A0A8J2KTZ7_9HEXA|nr:unnamed protein product [Allacma fusca]
MKILWVFCVLALIMCSMGALADSKLPKDKDVAVEGKGKEKGESLVADKREGRQGYGGGGRRGGGGGRRGGGGGRYGGGGRRGGGGGRYGGGGGRRGGGGRGY